MNKLIILDRDGVINIDSPNYIKSAAEWNPIKSSIKAISMLKNAGFKVAIATNQSAVGRGYINHDILTDIHDKMLREVSNNGGNIDKIFICPHAPEDSCGCRKPKPRMLIDCMNHFNVTPSENVYFVGDSWRDIEAATKAKIQPILVLTGNGKKTISDHQEHLKEIKVFKDLYEFVCTII